MKSNRFFHLFLSIIGISSIVACNKANMPTEIAGDLVPPVDNITVFDTTLEVITTNKMFDGATDSFRVLRSDVFVLGNIQNDPFFGKTDARVFMQVLPSSLKRPFGKAALNKLSLDSVVLVLDHNPVVSNKKWLLYGDTLAPQQLEVWEINPSNQFKEDSSYLLTSNPFTTAGFLGSKSIKPSALKDSVKAFRDTTANQLRIPLSYSFGQRLLQYDSTGSNNAYSTDSIFKTKLKGFEIRSTSGNGLMSFSIGGINTKLAIYYKYPDSTNTMRDTVVYFRPANGYSYGGAHNYIGRDISGTAMASASSDSNPDNLLYIQNTPGSFAEIKIPGLTNLSKRVIHLAQLSMEAVPDISDTLFYAPYGLILDVYNTKQSKYTTVPFSVIGLAQAGSAVGFSNYAQFGMYPVTTKNSSNQIVKQWKYNLTGYVQNMLLGKTSNYTLRLHTTPSLMMQFGSTEATQMGYMQINPAAIIPGTGRVRIAGGNHATQKMKLRIVYSKI